jgi:hypothetical protein
VETTITTALSNELKAWHKPDLKISLSGIYDLGDKIIVRADFFFINKQYAQTFRNHKLMLNGVIGNNRKSKRAKRYF